MDEVVEHQQEGHLEAAFLRIVATAVLTFCAMGCAEKATAQPSAVPANSREHFVWLGHIENAWFLICPQDLESDVRILHAQTDQKLLGFSKDKALYRVYCCNFGQKEFQVPSELSSEEKTLSALPKLAPSTETALLIWRSLGAERGAFTLSPGQAALIHVLGPVQGVVQQDLQIKLVSDFIKLKKVSFTGPDLEDFQRNPRRKLLEDRLE